MVCHMFLRYPVTARFLSMCRVLPAASGLFLVCALSANTGEAAADFQALFTRVADHVVVILCGGHGNDTWSSQGSGFILPGTRRVITAAHVIDPTVSAQVIARDGRQLEARLIHRDTNRDLAVLEISGEPPTAKTTSIPFVWSTKGLEGTEIASIASPKGLDFSLIRGTVSSVARTYRGMPALQAQLEAAPGASGGPVFLKDGRFLGLIAGRIPDQPWFSVIIPAPVILEFLAAAQTSPTDRKRLAEEEGALIPAASASATDLEALRCYNEGVSANDNAWKIECYRKAVATRDTFFEAWFNLGTALYHAGRKEDALDAYRKALALQPGSRPVIRNLGRVLLDLDNAEEAVSVFQMALSPEVPAEVYNDLGVALNRVGRQDAAENAFRNAIHRDPDYAPAYYNLAVCLARREQFEEAAQAFDQYLRVDPQATDAETVRQWITTLRAHPGAGQQ